MAYPDCEQQPNNFTYEDLAKLRHMLGVEGNNPNIWGYRNHYCPGPESIPSMERLESHGLVRRGVPYEDTNVFHATRKGCEFIGLPEGRIAEALGD